MGSTQAETVRLGTKWIRGGIRGHKKVTRLVGKHLTPPKTRIVTIADRESDVYDFIYRAKQLDCEIVIRVAQDRSVENETAKLWDHVATLPIATSIEVEVQEKEKQPARIATVDVYFTSLAIKAPATSKIKNRLTFQLSG